MAVAQVVLACLTLALPYIRCLWLMLLLFFAVGLFLGSFEAGANVFVLHLWGKEAAAFLQIVHFMFDVGAMVVCQIVKPFLMEDIISPSAGNSLNAISVTLDVQPLDNAYHPELLRLVYPYSMLATFHLFNAIITLIVWYQYPETPEHPSRSTSDTVTPADEDTCNSSHQWYRCLFVALTAVFSYIYYGILITFSSFLMTFVVSCKQLHMSKSDGAHLTTLFWTATTVQRLVTITILSRLSDEVNIALSLIVTLIGSILLLPFGCISVPLVWTGVAMIAVGTASIYACIFGFVESCFPVSSRIGSIIVMSTITGESVFPALVSPFIEADPRVLLQTVFVGSLVISLLFALMSLISRCYFKHGA